MANVETFRNGVKISHNNNNHTLKEEEMFDIEKIKKLRDLLKNAAEAFMGQLYPSAINTYNQCLHLIDQIKDKKFKEEQYIIKYLIALIHSYSHDYEALTDALIILKPLEKQYFDKIPTMHSTLALIYYKLYNFDFAQEEIKQGFEALELNKKFVPLYIPETNFIISETSRENFEQSLLDLKEKCSCWHQPDAICGMSDCQAVSHPYLKPRREIFFSDPAFTGLVSVTCSNLSNPCIVKYHIPCWKVKKEQLSPHQKMSDKNCIGLSCFTPNCEYKGLLCKIALIEIIGQDGNIKSTSGTNPKTCVPDNVQVSKGAMRKQVTIDSANSNAQDSVPVKHPVTSNKPATRPHKRAQNASQIQSDQTSSSINKDSARNERNEIIPEALNRLNLLRDKNFGISEPLPWNANADAYGGSQILQQYEDSIFYNDPLREAKCFTISYFYSFIDKRCLESNPATFQEVNEQWEEYKRLSEIRNPDEILDGFRDIVEFLLQSDRFFTIGNSIGTFEYAKELYDHNKAEVCFRNGYINVEEASDDIDLAIIEEFMQNMEQSGLPNTDDKVDENKNLEAESNVNDEMPENIQQTEYEEEDYCSEKNSIVEERDNKEQEQNSENEEIASNEDVYMSDNSCEQTSENEIPNHLEDKIAYSLLLSKVMTYENQIKHLTAEVEEKTFYSTNLMEEHEDLIKTLQTKEQIINDLNQQCCKLNEEVQQLKKTISAKQVMLSELLSAEKETRDSFKKSLYNEQFVGAKRTLDSFRKQCLTAIEVINSINCITTNLIGQTFINADEWKNSLVGLEKAIVNLETKFAEKDYEIKSDFTAFARDLPRAPSISLAETVKSAFSSYINYMCSMNMNNFSRNQLQQPVMTMSPALLPLTIPPPTIRPYPTMPPQFVPSFVRHMPPPPIPVPQPNQDATINSSSNHQPSNSQLNSDKQNTFLNSNEYIKNGVTNNNTLKKVSSENANSENESDTSQHSGNSNKKLNGVKTLENERKTDVNGYFNVSLNCGSTDSIFSLVGKSQASANVVKKTPRSMERLLACLQNKFPGVPCADLVESIEEVRQNHNNSLSGLQIAKILREITPNIERRQVKRIKDAYKVQNDKDNSHIAEKKADATSATALKNKTQQSVPKEMKTSTPSTSINSVNHKPVDEESTKKSTGTKTWKKPEENTNKWEKSEQETECAICCLHLDFKKKTKNIYTLECQHTFHTECLRNWFQHNKTCPNCRKFSVLNDEFPPLP